jgi:hypothetical protein
MGPAEYGFGILRTDGSRKPAAAVVSAAFAGVLTPQPYNGDFSDVLEGGTGADAWTPYMPTGTARVVGGAGAGGGNALVFSGTQQQSGGVTSWYVVPAQAVRPGGVWTVTALAQGRNATGMNNVTLSWFDGQGRWIANTASSSLPTGDSGWQRLTAEGAPPPSARAVEIHLQSSGNAGSVAFSHVSWIVK